MDDSALAAAAARGDQRAFTALIEKYRGYIYTIAYKVTLNADDALDVSQNVLLRLVERIPGYSGAGAFKSWLGAVTANEAISFVRKRARHENGRDDMDPAAMENIVMVNTADIREQAARAEMHSLVSEAMSQLSPQQRAVFALRFNADMKPREIARELDLPASQVRGQMVRAITRIRHVLFGAETGTACLEETND